MSFVSIKISKDNILTEKKAELIRGATQLPVDVLKKYLKNFCNY